MVLGQATANDDGAKKGHVNRSLDDIAYKSPRTRRQHTETRGDADCSEEN